MIKLSRWKVTLVVLAIIFGGLFAYPNLLSQAQRDALPGWLPKDILNLGLDLQGGSYLLLEVDVPAMRAKRISNLAEDARTVLQEAQVATNNIASNDSGVVITLANPAQSRAAETALRALIVADATGQPDRSVARVGENQIRYAFTDRTLRTMGTTAVDQSIEVVRRRIDSLGTREPSISRQGADRIVIQAPGESDPAQLERIIGQTAQLTFQMVDVENSIEQALAGAVPPDSELLPAAPGQGQAYYLVKRRVLVSGENLTRAEVTTDQNQQTAIGFRFDGVGARRFGEATAANIGRPFAIILDGQVISAPRINSAITGGSGIIEGRFSVAEAAEMVNLLNGGALPAPLKVEERRSVGAELGAEAVQAGIISTIIGFIVIVVFMFLAYGFVFGGVSIVALLVNVLLIIATMTLFQATLTLPGVAGLILSLAVAVDANVLIYERIRDEERAGHRPIVAMDMGFSRAMVSIADANITSLISALIMFSFGAGPVRGFAWTLMIGVFTSVFSAILVSQVLLGFWYRAVRPKTLPI